MRMLRQGSGAVSRVTINSCQHRPVDVQSLTRPMLRYCAAYRPFNSSEA